MRMTESAAKLLAALDDFLERERQRNNGKSPALNPGQRKQFLWPRQSISRQYNVKPTDFTRSFRFETHGEAFDVLLAETPFGIFGKCEDLKAEAKGTTLEQMLANLEREVEPLFSRQFAIARTLGLRRRFEGNISELEPADHLKLLYCEDRDVAHAAMFEIEAHSGSGDFGPALVRILEDDSHPYRRTAQWCTLDILEDLPNVIRDEEWQTKCFAAIRSLLDSAEDDYARTIYKAGDVLGDHVANEHAQELLVDVARNGRSPIGRRSAIHGLFHLCEWRPDSVPEVLDALQAIGRTDPEPTLRAYASSLADCIAHGMPHGPDPVLPQDAA